MRRSIGIALVGIALGCSDGAQGPRGAAGQDASASGASGKETTCAIGERFCDGSVIWACSRSGLDADQERDCAAGTSAANPGTCATDARCPDGGAPCCTTTLPQCTWSMTAPAASSGASYASRYDATESCVYSEVGARVIAAPRPPGSGVTVSTYVPPYLLQAPRCPGAYLGFQWTKYFDGCPRSYETVDLSLDRALVSPGTITLDAAGVPGVTLRLVRMVQTSGGPYGQDAATSCASWTGTVSWISDAPSWRVTLNATCAETGETATRLVATFNGDVP